MLVVFCLDFVGRKVPPAILREGATQVFSPGNPPHHANTPGSFINMTQTRVAAHYQLI